MGEELTSNEGRRLLMCRPNNYGLHYEINDWMDLSCKPDVELAVKQWNELYELLLNRFKLEIELIESRPDLPDMVFTANGALVQGTRAVIGSFRPRERKGEEELFEAYFKQRNFEVIRLSGDVPFEGEGDAFLLGETLVGGFGLRSDGECYRRVAAALGAKNSVLTELIDGRWYHLDTCFLPLTDNLVALYPSAMTPDSVQRIKSRFEVIEISEDEALRFACNSVVYKKMVAMPAGCPGLTAQLERRGFEVYSIEMSEFLKAGGSCKCLVLWI